MGKLSEKLNALNTQIEDLSAKIKSAHTYLKYKPIMNEMKTLTGRKKKKFAEVHADEIARYRKASQQLKEWFPDGSIPTPRQHGTETREIDSGATFQTQNLQISEISNFRIELCPTGSFRLSEK